MLPGAKSGCWKKRPLNGKNPTGGDLVRYSCEDILSATKPKRQYRAGLKISSYLTIRPQVYLGVLHLLSLLQGPLPRIARGEEVAPLPASTVASLLLTVAGVLRGLVQADHGRHHGRQRDEPENHDCGLVCVWSGGGMCVAILPEQWFGNRDSSTAVDTISTAAVHHEAACTVALGN